MAHAQHRAPAHNEAVDAILPVLIARIGGEMASLADRVTLLQALVELPEQVNPTPAQIEAVQSLDLVDQTLRALAGVLTRTTVVLQTSGAVDLDAVLSGCTLSDLSGRLAGRAVVAANEELELF